MSKANFFVTFMTFCILYFTVSSYKSNLNNEIKRFCVYLFSSAFLYHHAPIGVEIMINNQLSDSYPENQSNLSLVSRVMFLV